MRFLRLPLVLLSAAAFAQDADVAAIVKARQAVLASPDAETPRLELATLYLKLGQNHNASGLLLEYINTHPKSVAALRLLALSCLREENYTAARDYAQRVPGDAATTEVLGMAQLGLQDSKAAALSFQKAIQLDPSLADASFQLGLLYVNARENLPEAIRLLEKARSLKPNIAGIHTALGSVFLQSGKPAEAAAELEIAVKLDPESGESFYQLADAYRKLNRAPDADNALARFSDLSRKRADDRAREMRSRSAYEQGLNLLTNTDQLDKAYQLFEQAANVFEQAAGDAAYYRMAQIQYLKGNDPAGLKLIREALRLNPLEAEYYFVLARFLQSSDKTAALSAVHTAMSLHPGVPDFAELESELLRK
jgi:tetratricopeptide (TPR) repeat protein